MRNPKNLAMGIMRLVVLAGMVALCLAPAWAQSNACDLATPYGTIDTADWQAAINMTLGLTPCTANVVGTGICNVVVVQRVYNATLSGGSCVTGPDPHSVSLNWTASTSSGIQGYNVYRATKSGGPYVKQNTALVVANAYTDTVVTAGTTYFYVTTAINTSGTESAYSNEASATVPTP